MHNHSKINSNNVEDILPLTPMQEGMLFQYLKEEKSGSYFEQLCYRLTGSIKIELLRMAWQIAVDENEMLRTVFRWKNLSKPIQIVLKRHTPLIEEYDLTGISIEERQSAIEKLRREDRARNIDISTNPFRVTLCTLADNECEMIVSSNHIIYDGWSNAILLKELADNYNCLFSDRCLEKRKKSKYKEFIRWFHLQDKEKLKKYWQEILRGITSPTPLPRSGESMSGDIEGSSLTFVFDSELDKKIKEYLKRSQVTLAALMYTVWGIILSKYSGSCEVVLGITVSGRPSVIKGIEQMIGLFINSIPLRIAINSDEKAVELLQRVSRTVSEQEQYSYASLVDIKSYSEVDSKSKIFDSLIVIQNYPLDNQLNSDRNNFSMRLSAAFDLTDYSLYLGITSFEKIQVIFHYDTKQFDMKTVERLWKSFEIITEQIVFGSNGYTDGNKDVLVGDIDVIDRDEKNLIVSNIQKGKKKLRKLEEFDFDEVF